MVTGGLGPTSDDCTREGLAAAFESPLGHSEQVWQALVSRFPQLTAKSNRRQALIPDGWSVLTNDWGTASGLWRVLGTRLTVAALPGPPREFQPMVDRYLDRLLESVGYQVAHSVEHVLSTFGISESVIEDALEELAPDVRRHTRAEPSRIVVRLAGAASERFPAVAAALAKRFGWERIVAGEAELAEVVVAELAEAGVICVTAESCTGGLIGAELTSVPGSSAVVWGALVAYANEAKERLLHVDGALLARYGAVSAEVVAAMAEGALAVSTAQAAVAVSGIAGPAGGTPEKPVGTVWIAAVCGGDRLVKAFAFAGSRDRVRRAASREALLMLRVVVRQTRAGQQRS